VSADGEQVIDVDDWLDEEEQDEAAADQATLFAELLDQELSAAEQSSSDEEGSQCDPLLDCDHSGCLHLWAEQGCD
jgi:hypothetical protein